MRRAVFLDRDGTLNEDAGYFHEPEKLVVFPGVPKALLKLKKAGFLLIIITNQGAIGKGIYTLQDVEAVHNALQVFLTQFQVQIDGFFFCPHSKEENCQCRKPKPGMIIKARDKFDIDLAGSYIVGDKISDLIAGRAAGCRTVFVLTGHGQEERIKAEEQHLNVADFVARDMQRAAKWIIHNSINRNLIKMGRTKNGS